MATFTVHQWPDLAAGLAEVRRVTRGPVLLLTCDPAALEASWLMRYAPKPSPPRPAAIPRCPRSNGR